MTTQIKFGLFIVLAGIVVVFALTVRRTDGAKDEFRFDAANLKGRTTWTQVNAERYQMSSLVTFACAPVYTTHVDLDKKNPHATAYITVFVNKIGREAMFAK